jgi:hypothetical protein
MHRVLHRLNPGPDSFAVHNQGGDYLHNENLYLLETIIDMTRRAFITTHSRFMRRPCLTVLRRCFISDADYPTNQENNVIYYYFRSHFPVIRLQHLPFNTQAITRTGTWNPNTIFLNYDLANTVSNARTFGNLLDNRYTVNALMILIASLYHEYGHTSWNYFCPLNQRTPDGMEFGWAVEEAMFGGVLCPDFGNSAVRDYGRIEDLVFRRGMRRNPICMCPSITLSIATDIWLPSASVRFTSCQSFHTQ